MGNVVIQSYEPYNKFRIWKNVGVYDEQIKALKSDGRTLFVCSFEDNGLKYSYDGVNWTPTNITTGEFNQIEYANETWIAISEYSNASGQLVYSSDGKSWIKSSITDMCEYICYAGNLWFLVTYSSSNYNIKYSTNGRSWSNSNLSSTKRVNIISYGNGTWVAGCDDAIAYSSSDGKNWSICFNHEGDYTWENIYGVCYANGIWALCGGRIYWSTDAKNWTKATFSDPNTLWEGGEECELLQYFEHYGKWLLSTYPDEWSSTDGKTWVSDSFPSDSRAGYYYNGSDSLIVINGSIIYSSDDLDNFYYPCNEYVQLEYNSDARDGIAAYCNGTWLVAFNHYNSDATDYDCYTGYLIRSVD